VIARNLSPVHRFVAQVRSRVNTHRLCTAAVWGIVIGLIAFIVLGLVYVIEGESIPARCYVAASLLAGAAASGGWIFTRLTVDQSARTVDRFYSLHDAVVSYIHFQSAGLRGGFYDLQAADTQRRLAALSPQAIRYVPPRRAIMLALGCLGVAIPLGLRSPTAASLQRRSVARDTQEYSLTVAAELKRRVEELAKEVDDPLERKLVNPDQLRGWIDEIQPSADPKAALRELSQLERKLDRARLAIQRRREQQLLDQAGQELQTEPETRVLGASLAGRQYKDAAETLQQMRPQAGLSAAESRQDLHRLKAAALRMAAASEAIRRSDRAHAPADKRSNHPIPNDLADNLEQNPEHNLEKNLEQLAQAVRDFDAGLQKAASAEKQPGGNARPGEPTNDAARRAVDQQVERLANTLGQIAIRQQAQERLHGLSQASGQFQAGLSDRVGQKPGRKPGGDQAGSGTDPTRNQAPTELALRGPTVQLQGIRSEGPSDSSVEQAGAGSGVAVRLAQARNRQYQRQLESFVGRHDVPEVLKDGVKSYFQRIHQTHEPSPANGKGDDSSPPP